MQDSTVPFALDSISTRPYYAGELFVGFINQPGKHPLYTQVQGCDSEGGRATRMAPVANTEKIRDKNKSRFNSRQAVRSKPVHEQRSPRWSNQQRKNLGKGKQKVTKTE